MTCSADLAKARRQMTNVGIVITSRSGVTDILCSPQECAEVAYLISIGTATDGPPEGFQNVENRLRLEFEDVLEGESGPSAQDVAKLVRFAHRVDPSRGSVVVHCQGGISRSTAAAAIVLAVLLGPGHEGYAFDEVFRQRPQALPNGRMLELADTMLDNRGALAREAKRWSRPTRS